MDTAVHDRLIARFEPELQGLGYELVEIEFAPGPGGGTLRFYIDKPREIFVLGKRDAADTHDLLRHIAREYVPNRTLLVVEPGNEGSLPEIMRGKKQVEGKTTVYVCHAMTCSLPGNTWDEIGPLLHQ